MVIDEMPAGQEMDALVAEKVMGGPKHSWTEGGQPGILYTWILCEHCNVGRSTFNVVSKRDELLRENETCVRPYSTDIAAAWEVVKHFEDAHRFHLVRVFFKNGDQYAASFWPLMDTDVLPLDGLPAPTAPLAICRAALKAIGL